MKMSNSYENLDGESFLYHDSVSTRGKRMIIFASDEQMKALKSSTHFVFDGTFSSAPKPFVQVVTLLAEVGEKLRCFPIMIDYNVDVLFVCIHL